MNIRMKNCKTAREFRAAYEGCDVELTNSQIIPASQVTDTHLAGRQITGVYDPLFDSYYVADTPKEVAA